MDINWAKFIRKFREEGIVLWIFRERGIYHSWSTGGPLVVSGTFCRRLSATHCHSWSTVYTSVVVYSYNSEWYWYMVIFMIIIVTISKGNVLSITIHLPVYIAPDPARRSQSLRINITHYILVYRENHNCTLSCSLYPCKEG